MPSAGEICQGVSEFEKFEISIFLIGAERPVNSNKIIDGDRYCITTSGDLSASDWGSQFSKLYPGYTAQIKKADGNYYHGRTLLETVRNNNQ